MLKQNKTKQTNKIFTFFPAGKFVFKSFTISFIILLYIMCVVVCYAATHVEA